MIQTVFVLRHPAGRITEERAEIRVCERWTWAVLADGRRCLLGSSAFFTLKAAEIRKLHALRQIAAAGGLAAKHPHLWGEARRQLATYRERRTFH